jgi:hypothetical protein
MDLTMGIYLFYKIKITTIRKENRSNKTPLTEKAVDG